ncbi:MAG: hypothetical protein ACJAQW_001507 [Paracoccaceae bacterium]|jgi:hypothetical protein
MRITQASLPFTPWADRGLASLPGMQPVPQGAWLQVDDAYGAQMQRRTDLLAQKPEQVCAMLPTAASAVLEMLEQVVGDLGKRDGFAVGPDSVSCPDGRHVVRDTQRPLETLCGLVQEDFCVLQEDPDSKSHVLTAAILCFPASWTLAEKMGRPLIGIHDTVEEYDDTLARRVQRLFDVLRVGQPLWRANALVYAEPELFQPRPGGVRRAQPTGDGLFLRSERQSLLRLPVSRAVVFSIHTYVVPLEALTAQQKQSLLRSPLGAGLEL